MKARVIALSRDPYWLTALKKAVVRTTIDLATVECPGNLIDCIHDLRQSDDSTLMLVDASGQADILASVRELRGAGWRYVVAAAADPSFNEAISILRGNLGYDYWEKTYDLPSVKARIEKCLQDIKTEQAARQHTG